MQMSLFDGNGNGELGYEEFIRWHQADKRIKKVSPEQQAKLQKISKHFQQFSAFKVDLTRTILDILIFANSENCTMIWSSTVPNA